MPSTNARSYEPISPSRVAFLGLGVMGFPMAGHLALAGHQVTVYNRSPAKAEAWTQEFKGRSAATPRLAAQDADLIFCCVGNDDDLRSVTLGADGAFAGMQTGAIFVDHTTASASVARELAQAARQIGLQFIDAPVSGGQVHARDETKIRERGGKARERQGGREGGRGREREGERGEGFGERREVGGWVGR